MNFDIFVQKSNYKLTAAITRVLLYLLTKTMPQLPVRLDVNLLQPNMRLNYPIECFKTYI